MSSLIENLKQQIIETLNLEVASTDIDTEAPLFGDAGLGLDSIDALELIVLLDKEYGVKIANPADGQAVFHSVGTMARYIESKLK
jgi:acyl carrier protein